MISLTALYFLFVFRECGAHRVWCEIHIKLIDGTIMSIVRSIHNRLLTSASRQAYYAGGRFTFECYLKVTTLRNIYATLMKITTLMEQFLLLSCLLGIQCFLFIAYNAILNVFL